MSPLGILFIIHLVYLLSSNFFCSPSHRLTGWNAVKSRVEQLGLVLTDEEVRSIPFAFLIISLLSFPTSD